MKYEFNEGHRNTFGDSVRNVFFLVGLMWKTRPLVSSTWAILLLVASAIPAVQIWLQKITIDSISQLGQNHGVWKGVVILVVVLYFSNFFVMILSEIQKFLYSIVREDVGFDLKRKLAEKAVRLPLFYFENSQFYDRLQLAHDAINRNCLEMVNYIFSAVRILISLISMFGILAIVHWTLPVALVISSLPGIVILLIAKNKRFKLTVSNTPVHREMDYAFRLMTRREYAKEIRIYDLGQFLLERWSGLFINVRDIFLKQSFSEGSGGVVSSFFLSSASTAIALLLLWRIDGGNLTIGDYVALTGAVISIQGLLGSLGNSLGQLFEGSLHINHLFAFMETPEWTKNQPGAVPFPKDAYSTITVENLSFRYPNQERKILDDISFTINKGEKVAIVGENGAGKSTLVSCLLGLYQATDGRILFGDTEILDIRISSLRENVTAVFQDFVRYNYTIRENVGFGQVNQLWDDERIGEAIEKAGLTSAVEKMPFGISTMLGREFDGGQELSGGQWQRLAIARAFMRQSDVLVLDEPTSALDPQAELEILNRFMELSEGKTSLMISHRLGPARFADRILVLQDGKLVEQGNHEQLMEINGVYAKMYNAQAEWYQEKGEGVHNPLQDSYHRMEELV